MAAFLRHSSSQVLEFTSLRQILLGYASSPLGKSQVEKLEPSVDRDWIERQHRLTGEIREFLRAGGRFDFAGLIDPQPLLQKSHIAGAVLEITELRDVLAIVERAFEWKELSFHAPAEMTFAWDEVVKLSASIGDFRELLKFFGHKISPDGALDDRASPELARLRREIERQKRAIQQSLQSYLKRISEEGAAQDELISIRGERFVIPVKIEQKRRVQGVVHGLSSSGQTVFIEPLETIEQNNELVRLVEEEMAEIHRILKEMTSRVGEESHAIQLATNALAELELEFCKAHFADDYGCAAVTFTDSGLALENARHPVLERNLRLSGGRVVPLSLALEGEQRQIIISGPNTGGKTVGLKTIGLLALMAQAGIPVSAERARLPIFDAVLADIGDYQSIEQNLSTFSAHVTNINFISRTATRQSLVLLDELGSATDPEEGAALAVAIADFFRTLGAITIISTHHNSLKIYAVNTAGVVNAAVGFDQNTLQPTYELRVGVPGASAGISIAQRLGLNPQIADAARARVSGQTRDVAQFIDRLHEEIRQLGGERIALKKAQKEAEAEKLRLESEGMKEQRAQVKEMEKKLEGLLRDFEYQMRQTVEIAGERAAAQKLSKEAERRVSKLRREFKEQFDSTVVAHRTRADVGDSNAAPHQIKYVGEGDTVKLKSLGRNARVLRRIDANNLEVEVGQMKMKITRDDIAEVVGGKNRNAEAPSLTPAQAARSRGISVSLVEEDAAAPSEIHVIGQNVDEATHTVEKFIDRAFLAGLSQVRIVHGSGMGVLRKSLRQFLRSHPHVAKVSEPPQNEGGAGATVVELRS